MSGIQHTVDTVVSKRIAVAATVGCPVHGGDISVKTIGTVIVGQVLCKFTTGNSCQPTAYVIGICQLVGAAAMQLLGSHTSFVVVSIACKGYGTAIVQLVGYTADTVAMVICVGKMTSCSSRHRYTETP